jgi:hypothetical protein
MWEKYSAEVEAVTAKLKTILEREAESATSAGHLEVVLMWQGVGKKFDETRQLQLDMASVKAWRERFGDAPYPKDFIVALKEASASYERAVASLKQGYEQLVVDLTKSNQLDEAVAMRAEMQALGTPKATVPTPKPSPRPVPPPAPVAKAPVATATIVGRWTHPKTPIGRVFSADGVYIQIGLSGKEEKRGKWRQVGEGEYEVLRSDGFSFKCWLINEKTAAFQFYTGTGELDGNGMVVFRQ